MQIRGRYPDELSEGLMFFICPAVSGTNEKDIYLSDLRASVVTKKHNQKKHFNKGGISCQR
jgi:hypothetical protein